MTTHKDSLPTFFSRVQLARGACKRFDTFAEQVQARASRIAQHVATGRDESRHARALADDLAVCLQVAIEMLRATSALTRVAGSFAAHAWARGSGESVRRQPCLQIRIRGELGHPGREVSRGAAAGASTHSAMAAWTSTSSRRELCLYSTSERQVLCIYSMQNPETVTALKSNLSLQTPDLSLYLGCSSNHNFAVRRHVTLHAPLRRQRRGEVGARCFVQLSLQRWRASARRVNLTGVKGLVKVCGGKPPFHFPPQPHPNLDPTTAFCCCLRQRTLQIKASLGQLCHTGD